MSAPPPTATDVNPYPGLRPFREDEEHLFFGRERQVDAMVAKLRATRFLAVLGSSGSGKSSLVNCGLRPALYRGLMDTAGSQWRTALFQPGNRVMRAMAGALCARGALYDTLRSEDFSPEALVEATLRSSRLGLIDAFTEAHVPKGTQLLLVVDQFEELFRYRNLAHGEATGAKAHEYGPSADAVAFVNLLLAVREQPDSPIHVVITMRSDFLGDCAQFHGLPEALNAGQYLVPRMTRDERRMAITGPAGVEGASISPVLLTRLVNDVGDNPDQLSILQHALNRTWAKWVAERRPGGEVQLSHYEAIGTMSAALDSHAERAFGELDAAQQVLAERMFKVLTDSGTDARGIRRPTTFATLCEITQATPEALLAVMAVFRKPSRSFLMPSATKDVDGSSVIDISHESLMRVWQRLQAWGVAEAQSAQMLRRLADSAKAYPDKESLWQDPKLQLALNWESQERPNSTWARLYGADLAAALQFLRASEAERTRLEAAAKAEADRALKRARKRRLIGWGSLIVGLIAALAVTSWRYQELEKAAEKEALASQDRNVASVLFKMMQVRLANDVGSGESAEVPNLQRRPKEAAQRTLEDLRLGSEVSEVVYVSSAAPPGSVVDQFPRPPSRVALGDPVYLVVAITAAKEKENKAAAEAVVARAALQAAAASAAGMASGAPPARAEAGPVVAAAPAPPPAVTPALPASAATGPYGAGAAAAATTSGASAARTCPDGPWSDWLSNAQFQATASRQKEGGSYPAHIQGKLDTSGELRFRAVFAPRPKSGNFTWDIYRSNADRRTLQKVRGDGGLTIGCDQSFPDATGAPRWQLTWVSKPR